MNIKIYRAFQIGGCITVITTATTKIVIDMGEELQKSSAHIDICGILKDCSGVFFTHYHGDHLGLYKQIPDTIPIYIGEVAKQIFSALSKRVDKDAMQVIQTFNTFIPLQRIVIGDITITPLFIDHSAFDAYMFIIESGGEKILHTGDFRSHGFRGGKLIKMLKQYVGQVDVLITEGTTVSRENYKFITEAKLQQKAKELMKKYKYVFVLCSSTNIDRIAAFYHANPHGKYFLCDQYQKDVLAIVKDSAGHKTELYNFEKVVAYGKNIENRFYERGFCMLVRSGEYFKNIIDKYPKAESIIIYSMWKGYIEGVNVNNNIKQFLSGYDYKHLHTSGHADGDTIKTVIRTVNPKVIYPLHTENVDWFIEHFKDLAIIRGDEK